MNIARLNKPKKSLLQGFDTSCHFYFASSLTCDFGDMLIITKTHVTELPSDAV